MSTIKLIESQVAFNFLEFETKGSVPFFCNTRTHYQETEMTNDSINIVSVKHIDKYLLMIEFDDHTMQHVDFGPFLLRSRHPDIRAYLDPQRFANFRLIYGELVWGDYELNFPIIDLYRNNIQHADNLMQAA